jgi:uncharacterized phage-associated protein
MTFAPQSSLSVSRFFLESAKRDNLCDLTPMKMVKMVYIAHGWVLCFTEKPLLFERVQAWKYGPVVPNVYHEFKRFGDSAIPFGIAGFLPELSASDPRVLSALDGVWNGYKGFTGIQLSTMTHRLDTPWYVTWHNQGGSNCRGAVIDNQLIRQHYADLLQRKTGAANA